MIGELPALRPRPLAPAGTLGGDFQRGRDAATGLFPRSARRDPASPGGEAGREPRLDPDVLGVSNAEAEARVAAILDGEGVFVSTGQQPLLFLGPLYVLYKALTAVALAERLEQETGRPALALFWVAGDDHDWPEVGRTSLLDLDNELRSLELPPPEDRRGRAVGPTQLPPDVERLLDDLSDHLPNSEFINHYLTLFRDAYRTGETVSAAFADALVHVLEPRPLAWLDSTARGVRRAAAPLFERALREASDVDRRLADAEERVRSAGYAPQLRHEPGSALLFVDRAEGRTRVRTDARAAGDAEDGSGEGAPVERWLGELRERPEAFSPDVAFRPVLESWLLPVGATVLGPSEIAYWAQLPEVFEWAGTPMPRIRPRAAWTVIEDKIGKVLEKVGAEPEDFADGGAELERRVTEAGRPEAVEDALTEGRGAVGRAFEAIEEAVAAALPGIRSAVGAARHEAFRALEGLDDAVEARVREQEEIVLEQIRKAARHLYPAGKPQERVLNPLYYLARYGRDFVAGVERETRARLGGAGNGRGDAAAAETTADAASAGGHVAGAEGEG